MLDLLSFVAFILILVVLIYRDRKKAKFEGIMFIRRTKKGRNFIDRVAKSHSTFWNIVFSFGMIVAIPLILLISIYLINSAVIIASGQAELGGAGVLLPGPVSAPVIVPGLFIVPWWIWVIGVFSVMVPHEFSHGIVCRLKKIPIKSVGWLLFLFIPGAFVEPDEKRLEKEKKSTKIKVYAAGSFANITLAFIVLLILSSFVVFMFKPSGLFIYETVPGSPANLSGLSGTILEINGNPINSIEDADRVFEGLQPGDAIRIKTTENTRLVPVIEFRGTNLIDFIIPDFIVVSTANETEMKTIRLVEHNETERGFLGIQSTIQSYSSALDVQHYFTISTLLIWIYIFNFGIGLLNLLPIGPLDGGMIAKTLAGKSKTKLRIVKYISIGMLIILIFNIVGPIFI